MRYKSRLLSTILLSLIILVVFVMVASVAVNPEEPLLTRQNIYVGIASLVAFFIAYYLNKRGQYMVGAVVLVTSLAIAVFISSGIVLGGFAPRYDEGDVGLLAFLIFPLLVSGMLLALRQTIITSISLGLGMLLIPLFFTHISFSDILMGPLLLFLMVVILVIWTKWHRNQMEQIRQKELVESKEQYRRLVETLNEGIWQIDAEGYTTYVNPRMAGMLGYTVQEMEGKHLFNFMDNESIKKAKRKLEKRQQGVSEQHDFTFQNKNGEPVFTLLSTTPIFNEQDKYSGALAGVTDITEYRQAEERSLLANERLQYLLSSTAVVIYSAKPTDNYGATFISQNVEQMVGYRAEKFLQELDFWINHVHPQDLEKVDREVPLLFKKDNHSYEYRFRCKDGRYIWVRDEMKLIRDKDGTPLEIIGYWLDITERRRIEEELRKVEKLESLGVLAGGIAHDFNNLLTGIMGNVSLARMDAKGEIKEILRDVEKASRKAKQLTMQLLTFSKGGEPVREITSIKDLICESAEFVLHGSNVRCNYDFPDNLWKVNVDFGQISQVINNLIINADQAMPEGGVIEISAENVILEENNSMNLEGGNFVKVTIEDEGIGIPEKFQKKIFDPFFSTKSKGSGLGLSTVYSIIIKHGGYIGFDSKVGVGTTFYFYLPAAG